MVTHTMLSISKNIHIAALLRRSLYTTTSCFESRSHSADHYSKDVDDNPPPDSTVHRVDAASEAVQRPYESPSGKWSQAGTQTSEYQTVDKGYDVNEKDEGKQLRYGGVDKTAKRTEGLGEGPSGKDAGGRN